MDWMGFSGTWIRWIMKCVKTISYAIVINGEVKERLHRLESLAGRFVNPLPVFVMCRRGVSNA